MASGYLMMVMSYSIAKNAKHKYLQVGIMRAIGIIALTAGQRWTAKGRTWKERGMSDNVNHPAHYTQGGIECIDAIEAAVSELSGIEAVCTGNAIKYLWRWKQKNGVEDLKKARWYIDRLIAEREKND